MSIDTRVATRLLAAALLMGSVVPAQARSGDPAAENAVARWNTVAANVFTIEPGILADSRAYSILHAAIHDALNAIERRYEPYTADLSAPAASPDAAIASAAREVFAALSPNQMAAVEAAYAAALAEIPDGSAKDAGLALGRQCATANLERRASDGLARAAEPVYAPTGKPGDYDFTPPFDTPPNGPIALFPGWGNITPFGISLDDHRLPGPDRLGSKRYAKDYNLVKSVGSLDSTTRTADQTELARFWFEFSPIGWNRVANIAVRQSGMNPWDSARVFALVNFAMADGYIAGFSEKYRHRFWRPFTAIRRGGEDGNSKTDADASWLPLFSDATYFIPPVPDYPSTHTVLGAAAAEVLSRLVARRMAFEMTSTSLPGVTRRFKSFREAAIENGLSRVYGGIHFKHAVDHGFKQGRRIGRDISRLLPPVK